MKRALFSVCAILVIAALGCKSSTEVTQTTVPQLDGQGNVMLPVPAAADGIQLVYGPFDVPQGQEVQLDYYFKLPVDDTLDVDRIEIATNDGTHHMNLFRSFKDHSDTTEYSFASTGIWNSSDLMIECQQHYLDWSLPTGAAVRLAPHAQMVMQIHYVNATTQSTPNGKGKIVINLYRAKQKASLIASMLFASNPHILIPPHSDTSFSKFCDFLPARLPIQILSMTGHFHSRGKQFTVEKWDAIGDTSLGVIYNSTAWSEPPFVSYKDSPVTIEPGQLIKYTCHYHNDTDSTFTFGPQVGTNEHSNLFVWFIPGIAGGQTIYDSK